MIRRCEHEQTLQKVSIDGRAERGNIHNPRGYQSAAELGVIYPGYLVLTWRSFPFKNEHL